MECGVWNPQVYPFAKNGFLYNQNDHLPDVENSQKIKMMQEGRAGGGATGMTEVPWAWKLIDPEKKDPKVRCCKLWCTCYGSQNMANY
jgi:hypothetical protein